MSRQPGLIILILLILLGAGCGGGGGPDGSATQPVRRDVSVRLDAEGIPPDAAVRLAAHDATGREVWGPETFAPGPELVARDVPTSATAVRVEYVQGGEVVAMDVARSEGTALRAVDSNPKDVSSTVKSLRLSPASPSLAKGTTLGLTCTATFANGTSSDVTSSVTWSSAAPGVASVDARGVVTGVAMGTTSVSARLNSVSTSTTVTVTAAELRLVQVDPPQALIPAGTTQAYTATGVFSDGSTQPLPGATWSTGDPAVASVDGSGLATGLLPGQTAVTATFGGRSGSAVLSVTDARLVSLAVTPATATAALGTRVAFTATGSYTDGTTRNLTSMVTWGSSEACVAVDAGGVATAVALGSATVTAGFGGLSASAAMAVGPAELRAITVAPGAPVLPDGTWVALTATGSYSDGTVQDLTGLAAWSSSDPAVAEVDDAPDRKGETLAVDPGTAQVTATFGGRTGAATVTVTQAELVSLTVGPPTASVPDGFAQAFTATGAFTDGSTRDLTSQAGWTSSNPAVASVSAGVATGVDPGECLVRASVGGITGSAGLTVTPAVLVSLSVSPASPVLPRGTQAGFTAVGTFSDGTTEDLTSEVSWTSSDGSVAVFEGATAHALEPGQATVTATSGAVQGSAVLTVTAAALVSLTVGPPEATIADGTAQAFTATGAYTDGTARDLTSQASWTSSDAAVAAFEAAGLARGVDPGEATVTATVDGVQGTAALAVTSARLVSLTVSPPTPVIARGTTQAFTALGTYTDGTTQDLTGEVSWTSADEAVATMTGALASGREPGQCAVRATSGDVVGTAVLTVTSASLTSIALSPASLTLPDGLSATFRAFGTYSDGNVQDLTSLVAWTSDEPAVATFGLWGFATAEDPGTTTVRARLGDVEGTASVTVTGAELARLDVNPPTPTAPRGTTCAFTALGTFTDGSSQDLTGSVSWTSSDVSVASLTGPVATGVAEGQVSVTATWGAVQGTATLTVTAAELVSLAVSPATAQLPAGTSQAFTAVGTFTDGSTQDLTSLASWTSSAPGVGGFGAAGLLHALVAGSLEVTATVAEVQGTASVEVTEAVLTTVVVSPPAPVLARGTSQGFTATGVYSDGSSADVTLVASWSSTDPGVASVAGPSAYAAEVGQCAVRAQVGAVVGEATVTVTPAVLRTLTVSPPAPSLADGTTVAFTATGTFSDGTTQDLTSSVGWSSSDPSVVSMAPGGVATAVDPGAATVTASSVDVQGTASVTVTPAVLVALEVTPPAPVAPKGTSVELAATGRFSDGSVQDLTSDVAWTSSDPAVAGMTGSSATGLAEGQAVLQAALGGVHGSVVLTVTSAALVSVAVSPATVSLADGTSASLAATGTYTDGSALDLTSQATWTSSAPGVAAATPGGTVTALDPGSCTISATVAGVSGSSSVTVTAATLVSLAVEPASPVIAKGTTQAFTATGTFTDGSQQALAASWSSSDPTVASFTGAVATGLSPGQVTVTATSGSVQGTAVLTVTSAVLTGLAVTPASATIPRGTTKQFAAVGTYSDGSSQEITSLAAWSSSAPTVATVSNAAGSRGVATALEAGTTQVTATLDGQSGSASLTVRFVTELVSVDAAGTGSGNSDSYLWVAGRGRRMSDDGRYVVFASYATNLVDGLVGGRPRIYLRDRVAGTTRLVSDANADCREPCLSGDGKFAAWVTWREVSGGVWRYVVVRANVSTGAVELASTPGGGAAPNGDSWQPCLSGDGRYVCFRSQASNLGSGSSNTHIYVRDMKNSSVEWVTSGYPNSWSDVPVLSKSGDWVAWSSSSDFGAGSNGYSQVYRRKLSGSPTDRAVRLVSAGPGGALGASSSFWPTLSADGSVVAFRSEASNLVAGVSGGQIHVRNMTSGAWTVVSRNAQGALGNSYSDIPSLSDDGTQVAFQSYATNLVADDTNGRRDIFVARVSGGSARVSLTSTGQQHGWDSYDPVLSGDGRLVTYVATGLGLTPQDVTLPYDVAVSLNPLAP